jgi:hypothetical protein
MFQNSGVSQPSVYHALIVIFLEFFAWGLLTNPMIMVIFYTLPTACPQQQHLTLLVVAYEQCQDKTNIMGLRPAWIQTSLCIRAV